MSDSNLDRRDFMKLGGMTASAGALLFNAEAGADSRTVKNALPPETKFPKLAIISEYSAQKLEFAASAGYEGVVLKVEDSFDPDKFSDTQVDQITATARQAGVTILSLECMWGFNHIARDANERRTARARFVRGLEFARRLGCKFVGTFSGGTTRATTDDQVKELASVINETYLPVCEKLDLKIGPENYPCDVNFATVPAIWEKLLTLVPNHRFGLEFDPSHLVRQFIDPVQAAWDFRERILGVHAKDTELTEPVLSKVGIHGEGWWRYRIPGQGLVNWPKFITVLLQAGFRGGMAVEHEDSFWDENTDNKDEFPQPRKDGFILASRFLRQYLPGRPERSQGL
jgi:sugar phosphate isomerase/epimerase